MKIILISPYPDLQSFGLRTISSCLKRGGHDVTLVFLPKPFTERYNSLDEVVEFCKAANLIGISVMTNFFDNAVQITQAIKKKYDIPIIWGGIHPTIRPEQSIEYADMVCVGEGEEAVVELVDKMAIGQDYLDVQGIWFKGKINQPRPLIQLDSVPFPDYDYRTHFLLSNSFQRMDAELMERYMGRIYMTIPTRGCPFSCTYCCNDFFNNIHPDQKQPRKRSIDNIMTELIEAKKMLPFIGRIKFDDDGFFSLSLKEVEEFSEKYKMRIGLPLIITGATPATLNDEKLSLLVDAGLVILRVGIQSASEHTKKLYNRHHTNQQVEKAARIIKKFKEISTQYDIILDNPWETEEDLIETLMFVSRLPIPYVLSFFSLAFYPGTKLYNKAKAEGIIKDDLEDVYRKHYHGCRKTYLNRCFFLLSDYAQYNIGISQKTMNLLSHKNWILFFVLKVSLIPIKVKSRIAYLISEGLKDIKNGNWVRISKWFRWSI